MSRGTRTVTYPRVSSVKRHQFIDFVFKKIKCSLAKSSSSRQRSTISIKSLSNFEDKRQMLGMCIRASWDPPICICYIISYHIISYSILFYSILFYSIFILRSNNLENPIFFILYFVLSVSQMHSKSKSDCILNKCNCKDFIFLEKPLKCVCLFVCCSQEPLDSLIDDTLFLPEMYSTSEIMTESHVRLVSVV